MSTLSHPTIHIFLFQIRVNKKFKRVRAKVLFTGRIFKRVIRDIKRVMKGDGVTLADQLYSLLA